MAVEYVLGIYLSYLRRELQCCGKSIVLGHKNLVQASTLPFIGVIIEILSVSPSLIFFFCKMEVIVPNLCFIDLMK